MKLLIVGSDKIYAIENFYVNYLRKLGVSVHQFSAQSLFYDYYQQNLKHKLLFKVGLSKITHEINEQFKKEVEFFKPEVIWVFKGMELYPASLQWAKGKGIKLVNYNPDSPFIFSGAGSGNKNVTESIPLYDLFLTYNISDKIKMEKDFGIASEILPFGYNLEESTYNLACGEVEKLKLCFLGNPDKYRAEFLTGLAEMGLVMDVFGNDWKDFVNNDNISIHEPVYENDFWITLRKYRVQLNLMRPHNPASHNMRSFEAAGVGAIQLAPDTEDHRKYFKQEEEIFLYDDLESCFHQVKKILALPCDVVDQLRKKIRGRAIEDGYNYESRAAQAHELIKRSLK